ncbi:unnamed protein product [marine sediment metagenome]|uniref:Transposase DDE domain-containing protein n=1 Tax=marine sediment metagenome TaxID=412755 RepID=X1M565_9ZZZZ
MMIAIKSLKKQWKKTVKKYSKDKRVLDEMYSLCGLIQKIRVI